MPRYFPADFIDQPILHCAFDCPEHYRKECPAAWGMRIDHLDIEADYWEEDGYVSAFTYCDKIGEDDVVDMVEEVDYDLSL